jgi:hypothetical protein
MFNGIALILAVALAGIRRGRRRRGHASAVEAKRVDSDQDAGQDSPTAAPLPAATQRA